MADSSQKFIARNRAPRVQIEYDVELYGSEKKVQLPFVMGVMSDLVGKSRVAQPEVEDRKFLEIDVDNFDDRMKAMAPRAAFTVPNTLTGEGNLSVDLTFEKMSDFTPAAIAAKVDVLRPLLEARMQLSNLMAYMDGKAGAEALIERILSDPGLLAAISDTPDNSPEATAALESLKAAEPVADADLDEASDPLDALRQMAPGDDEEKDGTDGALAALKAAPLPEPEVEASADVLADLSKAAPDDIAEPDLAADVLGDMARSAPVDDEEEDGTDDALAALKAAPLPESEVDASADVLADLSKAAPDEIAEPDPAADVLGDMARSAPVHDEEKDGTDDALAALKAAPLPEVEVDASAEVLADLSVTEPEPGSPEDDKSGILADLVDAATETVSEDDHSDDVLSDLATDAPEEPAEDSAVDDLLGDLAADAPEEPAEDSAVDDLLGDLAADAPEEPAEGSAVDDLLGDLAADAPEEPAEGSAVDDLLGDLAADVPEEPAEDSAVDDLLGDLAADALEESPKDSAVDDLLGDLAADAPEEPAEDSAVDDLLGDLAADALEEPPEDSAVDDLLGDLAADVPEEPAEDSAVDDLLDDLATDALEESPKDSAVDDLLGDLAADVPEVTEADVDLDDLLAEIGETPDPAEVVSDDSGLDDLLADSIAADDDTRSTPATDELADLLQSAEDEDTEEDIEALLMELDDPVEEPDSGLSGLDDLMADLDKDQPDQQPDELDALFAELAEDSGPPDEDTSDDEDLDALLAGLDEEPAPTGADDLDDLLADLDSEPEEQAVEETPPSDDAKASAGAVLSSDAEFAFGVMGAPKPDAQRLNRKRFRIALFGDFSGRSARGKVEIGDDLALREPVVLDPDTVEDVIKGFATTLVLPIGRDGAGIEVSLRELDDLHPDELYENVELFSGLSSLKAQLAAGATAASAAQQLKSWGESFGQKVSPPRKSSAGTVVRADLKLSEFQMLIGDTGAALAQASPLDDLLARVVGPHIRAVPDADTEAMKEAVDSALSEAMRLVLHHPDFAAVEAQWRSLDLIARSVETDDTLDVVLHDVSAEEIAADLASADDLSSSGLVRLLTEGPLDEENGRGGYSALIGLYTFEETPPHAELLGRVARVAAFVDAPFVSAITPAFLDVAKEDRHPLVAQAWDSLRAMPEAGYLGLASPRFLLRRPYGQKSEPIYEFEFEEFTMSEGLRGMLWANPAVLVTILLAKSFRQNGASMGLGQIMSLGDMPYHYVTDRYGDQVALPCTERNITLPKHEHALQRGYMPVLSVKGRDEIRLGSFNSLAGREILGPWNEAGPPPEAPPDAAGTPQVAGPDELPTHSAENENAQTDADDLDALLASFDDETDDSDGSDIDAELAALLEDL